jgi:hypothetical protein
MTSLLLGAHVSDKYFILKILKKKVLLYKINT